MAQREPRNLRVPVLRVSLKQLFFHPRLLRTRAAALLHRKRLSGSQFLAALQRRIRAGYNLCSLSVRDRDEQAAAASQEVGLVLERGGVHARAAFPRAKFCRGLNAKLQRSRTGVRECEACKKRVTFRSPEFTAGLRAFSRGTAEAGVIGIDEVYPRWGEVRVDFCNSFVIHKEDRENAEAFRLQPETGFQRKRSNRFQMDLPDRIHQRV